MTIQQCSIYDERNKSRCPEYAKHRQIDKGAGFRGRFSIITYLCDMHYKAKMENRL